jgi:putative NADPH-quinone reductase
MDTPTIYNWLVYGNANINQIKTATLQFCGVSPVRVTKFGGVRGSSPEKRQKWLDEVRQIAQKEA